MPGTGPGARMAQAAGVALAADSVLWAAAAAHTEPITGPLGEMPHPVAGTDRQATLAIITPDR
jgi:hypothetical protein